MDRRTKPRLALVCILLLAALAVASCSSGRSAGGTGAESAVISEQKAAFNPVNTVVKSGDSLTFKNNDSVAHSVTIDGRELGIQNPGESKTWTASKDGSYPFSCVIHPSMTGRITVGDSSNAPSGGTGSGGAPPSGGGGYNY